MGITSHLRRTAVRYFRNHNPGFYGRGMSPFKLNLLSSLAKKGGKATLVGATMLYGWDQFKQYENRILFKSLESGSHTSLITDTAIDIEDMDEWDYSSENNLVIRFGKGTMVRVGGGRKV